MESRILAEHVADHLKTTLPRLPYNYAQVYVQVLARGARAEVHCVISKPCLLRGRTMTPFLCLAMQFWEKWVEGIPRSALLESLG